MSDVPVQVVVAAFKSPEAADRTLEDLKLQQEAGQIKIDAAAVLTRDMDNQLHIKDTRDWGFGRGALAGGAIGAVLGIMTGPVGWAVLGSALIGGVAAKMHHTYNFNEARLRKLGDSLQPGDSAIVAVVEHIWVAQVEATMREQSTDVLVESISKDIADQLAAGNQAGYTIVSTGDTVATERVVSGENETLISDTIYTSEGVYTEAADITKDHVTYGAAVANEQGVTAVIIEGTPDPENAPEATSSPAQETKPPEAAAPASPKTPTPTA